MDKRMLIIIDKTVSLGLFPNAERDKQILLKYLMDGITMCKISKEYNITPQRVGDIVDKFFLAVDDAVTKFYTLKNFIKKL